MRAVLIFGVAAAALLAAGAAQAKEPSVEIRDAVARVTIVPEARSDVKVVISKTSAQLPLTVRVEGDKTIVDGDLDKPFGGGRINSCKSINGKVSVHVVGVGNVAWDAMPEIIVYTPMNSKVGAGGAVFGSVGRTDSLELSSAGCGDWTVANVGGELKANLAGSGDLKAGSAGSARVNVSGSGDINTTAVRGDLSVNIAGSGDVEAGPVGGGLSVNIVGSGDTTVASVNGAVSANIAGSGDVQVRSGQASSLSAKIAGSGDVLFGGTAGSLVAKVAGSGDVRVVRVSGTVTKSVAGSGDVVVGSPIDFDD